jgi:RHS repeat-associated protein
VTLTTTWQQFTVRGTLQSGLTALALQIGGGHTIQGGQVYNLWGAELGSGVADGGVVTNILPASQQVTGPSWEIQNGTLANNSVVAPDGTSTGTTMTATSGSPDSYLTDYAQNPSQYSGQVVTASVYLRVPSGTQNIDLFLINVGASGWGVASQATVVLNTSWQRFELTGTNQAALTTLYLQIGGGYSVTSGQSICVWGAQMVLGSNPDGYVETQNTATVNGTNQTLAANGLTEAYSYDAFGNLQESGSYSFIQAYTVANQLSGWGYDAAGNLLADALGSIYQYDAEGKIKNASGTSYVYDAEGRRVEKSGTAVVDTIYFGGQPVGRLSGGAWTDLIYGVGGLLAEVPGTQTGAPVYRMTDHLGSSIGTLSSTGSVLSTQDIAPFGEIFSGGSSDPFVFTGKERDFESGNDYFGARYYDSNMGRFMSPDWSSDPDTIPYAEFENPQTLNLYSYGHNNPLLYNDTDGHDVTICDNNGNCQAPISDDAYRAAQQASNSSLNGPSLAALQNSSSGTGTLTSTDANGNTTNVGTAKWTPDHPGIQGPAAMAGFNQLANTSRVVSTGTAIYAGAYGTAFFGPMAGAAAANLANTLRAGMTIGGHVLTQHAVEQAEERGVTLSEIEEAVEGVAKGNPQNGWDSVQRFYTSTCEVRVNKITGTIVTIINKVSR